MTIAAGSLLLVLGVVIVQGWKRWRDHEAIQEELRQARDERYQR